MMRASTQLLVTKRDGREVAYDRTRIEKAIAAAFAEEMETDDLGAELVEAIATIASQVETHLEGREALPVEEIQDEVERCLMRSGYYTVARRYILYRERRALSRRMRSAEAPEPIRVRANDSTTKPLDQLHVKQTLYEACHGLPETEPEELITDLFHSLYQEIPEDDVHQALVLVARSRMERDPSYEKVAARILLKQIREEVLGGKSYSDAFVQNVYEGVDAGLMDEKLLSFDLTQLAEKLTVERDESLSYLGLQTLYDRYLINQNGRRIELPQFLWMRVAMGLSYNEDSPNERALEFYQVLSTLRYVSGTPTLFNAGTKHPQLSSCYLSTVEDDLHHIFKVIGDNAQLSKWAGGIGNDWTPIRATGARIHGTNGNGQGVIPFLKIVNDTAVAVNQGGKRRGACCAYLETWHYDIEEFLDLRKNTGDDRRRTHDLNTANWIPDLFMKRVQEGGKWSLLCPSETKELHDLYGKKFEEAYEEYERKGEEGRLKLFRQIDARELWRKMLTALFETGHPWITFKDPSNIRSPQDHVGVVHSSNLCTEILLNTSSEETAVCNLGSVNLAAHWNGKELDRELLARTVSTAVRMLDNVVDINFYPTQEAANANKRHRPVGLGMMGFQDLLYLEKISYASEEAVRVADEVMEWISYHAFLSSALLAGERGRYESYEGSKWSRGLLPIDTIDLLEKERGEKVEVDRSHQLDWLPVRAAIEQHGMRNSNVLAIAPTATIGNISGVTQSIEPTYRNLFVKSNLSGEFTVINRHLVQELKEAGLWDQEMVDDLKYYDGSIQEIERIPAEMQKRYLTAFEIDSAWLIECAARRQKWIDQGISLNLYLPVPEGKRLDEMYRLAWKKGLKTTYYLRSLGATQVEKSSIDLNKRGIQPRWMKSKSASAEVAVQRSCSIDDPDCEACQ